MNQEPVFAKLEDLSFTPIGAVILSSGNEHRWSVPLPMEQAKDMEADGFDIGWLARPPKPKLFGIRTGSNSSTGNLRAGQRLHDGCARRSETR